MAGFLDLYDNSFDDVYRYVYFKVGNKWDTDDLVSEIFLKAFQKRATLRHNERAWLFTVARNTITDYYRVRGREVPDEAAKDPSPCCSANSEDSNLALECLREALVSLNPMQRELINLRYFAGLRHREVAKVTGISEGSTKMRVHRILSQIKELVEKCLVE